ncbi:MAG: dipicolinate synthase subunit B [Oscillospiraceae bacterium]|nr:dipicolinate synthase subunit B [Oscillospiraceae bacterium]
MKQERVGFALCGSFCTHQAVLKELEHLCGEYETVLPVVSPISQVTDTRFGAAKDFLAKVEELTGHKAIRTIAEAEPIGPKKLLDILVIAPCTGNTIGKLAAGITDTPVTMAAKAHLRNDRPVVIAVASNDGLSGAAKNLGELLVRKNYFFVPFGQDDAERKPCSLMADFSRISETVRWALDGKQLQPLLLR